MKNLRTAAICACITFSGLCASAQNGKIPINEPDYNKPKLFDNLPDKIPVSLESINSLFSSAVGKTINVSLSKGTQFQFEGQVISKSSQSDNNVQSILVRSSNYNGATLSISKITLAGGVASYIGRIMSFHHGDLYELQNQQGNLVLVKRKFYDLVNE